MNLRFRGNVVLRADRRNGCTDHVGALCWSGAEFTVVTGSSGCQATVFARSLFAKNRGQSINGLAPCSRSLRAKTLGAGSPGVTSSALLVRLCIHGLNKAHDLLIGAIAQHDKEGIARLQTRWRSPWK